MSEAILKVKELSKSYVNQTKNSSSINNVLNDIELEVKPEEFLCILGPSGCGKSTLLRCIAGFEDYEGTIEINGKVKTKPDTDRIVVFQDFNQLLPWKTVEKNVQYPLKLSRLPKDERRSRSDEYIEMVGLSAYKKFYPHQLSGGMKQRAAIARSLALKPNLILMDEPFASLDAMTRNKLQAELWQIKEREKTTVIFITHNIQEALCLGTRIIMMNRLGKIQNDVANTLPKPVTPATPGYAELWNMFHEQLNIAEESRKQSEPTV